jgi:hypothetical protein
MNPERRPVKHSSMLIYTIGRTYLIELYHAEMQSHDDLGVSCAILAWRHGIRIWGEWG